MAAAERLFALVDGALHPLPREWSPADPVPSSPPPSSRHRALYARVSLKRIGKLHRVFDECVADSDPPEHIAALCFAVNHIRTIRALDEPKLARSLLSLDLSRNLIERVRGLGALKALVSLNLSNNHIAKIEGLDALVSLEYLDLSMNEIKDVGRGLVALTRLRRLRLHGNGLSGALTGLETLTALETLELQRNALEDVTHVGLLRTLRDVNIAQNRLADLRATGQSLGLLPELHTVQLHGNPLAEDENYRIVVLQNEAIRTLDNTDIKPWFRGQLATIKRGSDVENVIERVTDEYVERIRIESEKKERSIEALRQQQRFVQETFDKYRSEMEHELEETVRYLQLVRSGTDPAASLSDDELAQWHAALTNAAEERARVVAAEEKARWRDVESDVLHRSAVTSLKGKLFEISLAKPKLWRTIKQAEARETERQEQQFAEHVGAGGARSLLVGADDGAGDDGDGDRALVMQHDRARVQAHSSVLARLGGDMEDPLDEVLFGVAGVDGRATQLSSFITEEDEEDEDGGHGEEDEKRECASSSSSSSLSGQEESSSSTTTTTTAITTAIAERRRRRARGNRKRTETPPN